MNKPISVRNISPFNEENNFKWGIWNKPFFRKQNNDMALPYLTLPYLPLDCSVGFPSLRIDSIRLKPIPS